MQGGIFFGTFLVIIVIGAALTVIVRTVTSRGSTPVVRAGDRPDVLFVVSPRRWQRVVLRTVGIVMVVVAGFIELADATTPSAQPNPGESITGGAIVAFGVYLIWGAHIWSRKRLEVTPDAVWEWGSVGKPRRVELKDVTRLTPIPANNFGSYGGVVARAGRRRLFSATRTMLGYRELIDHLRENRPDLTIPRDAQPY